MASEEKTFAYRIGSIVGRILRLWKYAAIVALAAAVFLGGLCVTVIVHNGGAPRIEPAEGRFHVMVYKSFSFLSEPSAEGGTKFKRFIERARPSMNPFTILRTRWMHRWRTEGAVIVPGKAGNTRVDFSGGRELSGDILVVVSGLNPDDTSSGVSYLYCQSGRVGFLAGSKGSQVLIVEKSPGELHRFLRGPGFSGGVNFILE